MSHYSELFVPSIFVIQLPNVVSIEVNHVKVWWESVELEWNSMKYSTNTMTNQVVPRYIMVRCISLALAHDSEVKLGSSDFFEAEI